jgi:hypothetical protein
LVVAQSFNLDHFLMLQGQLLLLGVIFGIQKAEFYSELR